MGALFEIMRDARVMRYLAEGKPFTREQTEEFLIWAEKYQRENGFCRWKVIEKSSGEVIGSCGFARPHDSEEIELGYLLARKHWGKGFATDFSCAMTFETAPLIEHAVKAAMTARFLFIFSPSGFL